MRFLLLLAPLSAVLVLAHGCATSGEDGTGTTGSNGATGASGGSGGASASVGGSGPEFDAGQGGAGAGGTPLLYVHSNSTLFRGDPSVEPLELTTIGAFDCLGGSDEDPAMTDFAVNEAGELWGISESNVYRFEIEGSVVHCEHVIPLDNPENINFYGLTFAPKGVLSPDEEVLLAANSAGEIWSVDSGGNLTQRGTFGIVPANDGNGHTYDNAGKPWELSGDIVVAANGGNPIGFATVRDCPDPPSPQDCNPIDTLVELDVAKLATTTTGSVTKSVRGQVVRQNGCSDGSAGYGSVYGVAAWQGKVFGFSRVPNNGGGFAIEIANTDGAACLIQAFPDSPWAGAGITTIAPIEPPPPK